MTPGEGTARRYVDLHMHSTASDGSLPPADVVAAAARAGLAAIALTDHDSVAGMEEAHAAGERLDVRVIAGAELSAHDETGEVHLLALHLSRLSDVEEALAALRDARRVRAHRIVERLNALGIPLTMDAVLHEAGPGAIGRPHVARALISDGWAVDLRDAFDRLLGAGRPAFVEKQHLSIGDAVRLAHSAGGIAVLAHPGAAGTRSRLLELRALGLDGVEVRHPSHNAETIARLGALADQLDLVPSGGSDWHGAAEGTRTIGCMHVPGEWLARQEARVQAARQRVA